MPEAKVCIPMEEETFLVRFMTTNGVMSLYLVWENIVVRGVIFYYS